MLQISYFVSCIFILLLYILVLSWLILNLVTAFSASAYVFCMCVHKNMHTCVEARGSSITHHIIQWYMISHCVQISLIWQGWLPIQSNIHACVAKPLPAGPFPWPPLFIYHILKPAQNYYICNNINCFLAFWVITTLECILLMERARDHFCGFPFSYLLVSENHEVEDAKHISEVTIFLNEKKNISVTKPGST